MGNDRLKTPAEWEKETGIRILDPDGWRGEDAPAWEDEIDEDEWWDRMSQSTVDAREYLRRLDNTP